MAHDVFISHSHNDKAVADAACAYLEAQKIRCWIAPRDVPPAADFAGAIVKAINAARVFVLIFSGSVLASHHVKRELTLAANRQMAILPMRTENIVPTGPFAYYLSNVQWLDIIDGPIDGHLTTLARTVARILGRPEIDPKPTVAQSGPIGRIGYDGPDDEPAAAPATTSGQQASRSLRDAAVLPARKVNPIDGAEMVLIPAGPFLMGDDDRKDNKRRTVTLDAYYIYKNVVTVRQYEGYCKATGNNMPKPPKFNSKWKNRDHPIVNVSWFDAMKYCEWAGVSLPTEQQWEKAARGTDGRQYPWGNTFDSSKLWWSKEQLRYAGRTTAVGRHTDSPYGLSDMAGNVWQWCADDYDGTGTYRVLRGGSWSGDCPELFRCAGRLWLLPVFSFGDRGFRCVARPNSN
jgi:formylglycine-generating enzyme required for sulfatase activity